MYGLYRNCIPLLPTKPSVRCNEQEARDVEGLHLGDARGYEDDMPLSQLRALITMPLTAAIALRLSARSRPVA